MPAIADFNHEDFDVSQQTKQDEMLLVKFYTKSVQDKARSEAEGRPIFKDVEYVDIRVPGSRDGAARPATFRDKQRFPRHYQAFKQRTELSEEGTPLTEWGAISRSLAEELSFQNVKTVEQLAGMSDGLASQMRGGQSLKAKAQKFLDRMKREVSVEKLEAELADRDKVLDGLQEQIKALQEQLEQKEA